MQYTLLDVHQPRINPRSAPPHARGKEPAWLFIVLFLKSTSWEWRKKLY
jgi:hypothetical protein